MIDNARFTLRRLIEQFGPGLVRDPHRLGALLRDECGEYKREISVIMLALEEEVVDALQAAGGGLAVTIPRLAKDLHAARAVDESAARWVVDTWAHALGLAAAADDDATNETWLDVPVRKGARADDEVREREAARLRGETAERQDAAARERQELERRRQEAERARQEAARRREDAGQRDEDGGAAPPPSLVARVLGFFRTPEGKPRWLPIGIAVAVAAAVLWQTQEPPLRIVEVAHPKQFPANGTDVDFLIRYEGGDVVQIERKVLRGGWRDDTLSYKSDGKPSGTAPMKIRASRPEAGAFRLVAIDAKGRRSAAVEVEFEATAPPQPAQPLRITGVTYPRRFPADNTEVEFKVQYEGGDVVKLERKSLRGSWSDHELSFSPGGSAKGSVAMKIRAKSPERAAFRLTVVDAAGRRSAPYDVEFEATPAGAGPAPAGTLRITGIDYPRQLPLGRQSAFDVSYDGLVGGTVRLEYVSLRGRWGDKTIPYTTDGRAQGRVRLNMTANAPGPGGLRITLIDERGNRSPPQDVYFDAVAAALPRR
jgi:hypothetical protein